MAREISEPIIFESLEDSKMYFSIREFISANQGYKMIQRQTISFVGIENVLSPIPALDVDGVRIPRFIIHILSDIPINIEPLLRFLTRKRAFWMISYIVLYNAKDTSQTTIYNDPEKFLRGMKEKPKPTEVIVINDSDSEQ